MKKILFSLSIIGVVAAIVVGGTMALFNDTETSTGNIFTAGDIDLKVDHKYSSYNEEECTRNCVENLGENLIKNGSFEVPEVTNPAKWQIFPSGSTGLEWTIEWVGNTTTYNGRPRPEPALVEYHEGVLGNAHEGNQYTELDSDWYGPNDSLTNEPALVKIHQNIVTTPGAKYKLHYYFSPRPNTSNGENIMYVNVDNILVATHNTLAGGATIAWQEYTYEFTATGASTKVEFVGGGTNNSLGLFLDDVSLWPYTCDYQVIGGTCTLWGEKDLGQGDVFWNFNDVKPGDRGINIISLHAYSNDAYACVFTGDIVDTEDTVIDPEIEAGDTINSVVGELSQYIKVFAWEDSTQNNVYDIGENILLQANSPIEVAVNPSIALTASNTKFIGLAWCAGTQSLNGSIIVCDGSTMGDITQTDIMTASITAYAEQQRNNAGFDCASLLPQNNISDSIE